jgi:hypothetical protein
MGKKKYLVKKIHPQNEDELKQLRYPNLHD